MKILAASCMCAALLLCAESSAQPVDPSLEVASVILEVTWVETRTELEDLRREYGHARAPNAGRPTRLNGFSVLGKRDGKMVCLLFVKKPESVNDEKTLAIGHEVLHCLLGDYHRT